MNILMLLPEGDVLDMFFPKENREKLDALGNVTWNTKGRHYTKEEVKEQMPSADVVLTGWGTPSVTGDMLDEKQRLLAHVGGSVAPYTDAAAFQKGLAVTCANEIFAQSVAEGTLAYMLAGLRRIPYWDAQVKQGNWREDTFRNQRLMGKRVGITGYGAIARNLIQLLAPFGVDILLNSGHLQPEEYEKLGVMPASLEEIFETCDIISLHNGLNEKTEGMVSAQLLDKIKEDALFINTARGGLVDEAALTARLAAGRFHAVLDVFQKEPLEVESRLRKLPNAILIPHMAGPTSDLYALCGRAMVEETERYKKQELLKYGVEADVLGYMTVRG